MTRKNRLNISSESPYESIIGISRASKIGQFVSISGTAPIGEDGKTVGVGDPAKQTHRCLEIIRLALEKAGGELSDVIRTRLILTNINDWVDVSRTHGEYFKDIKPASTVMQVSSFVNPEWLVEIEADAVIAEQ